ncbi:hypothetical protein DFJ74DRAFT_681823 [Hyaloraphidium curvatum]|nr:hypothetical protein DFJ74DRAFT_681823 [Hyaloraphidium curvatum]
MLSFSVGLLAGFTKIRCSAMDFLADRVRGAWGSSALLIASIGAPFTKPATSLRLNAAVTVWYRSRPIVPRAVMVLVLLSVPRPLTASDLTIRRTTSSSAFSKLQLLISEKGKMTLTTASSWASSIRATVVKDKESTLRSSQSFCSCPAAAWMLLHSREDTSSDRGHLSMPFASALKLRRSCRTSAWGRWTISRKSFRKLSSPLNALARKPSLSSSSAASAAVRSTSKNSACRQ